MLVGRKIMGFHFGSEGVGLIRTCCVFIRHKAVIVDYSTIYKFDHSRVKFIQGFLPVLDRVGRGVAALGRDRFSGGDTEEFHRAIRHFAERFQTVLDARLG